MTCRTLEKQRENSTLPRFPSTLFLCSPTLNCFVLLFRNTRDAVLFPQYKVHHGVVREPTRGIKCPKLTNMPTIVTDITYTILIYNQYITHSKIGLQYSISIVRQPRTKILLRIYGGQKNLPEKLLWSSQHSILQGFTVKRNMFSH